MTANLDEESELREALECIKLWSESYPFTVFPAPDLKRASELLKAGGMTLDSVSADIIRRVLKDVGKIARDALLAKDG